MKGITITKSNYAHIASKLTKFFQHGAFWCWHQFDCGMKKRIKDIVVHYPYNGGTPKLLYTRRYYNNITTDYQMCYGYNGHPKGLLCVRMNEDEAFCIHADGSETIWFLGNRIIIKRPAHAFANRNYLYECFQIA